MSLGLDNDMETLDYKTARSICDAVGERLQEAIRPETALSDRLRDLLEDLRRQDRTGRP